MTPCSWGNLRPQMELVHPHRLLVLVIPPLFFLVADFGRAFSSRRCHCHFNRFYSAPGSSDEHSRIGRFRAWSSKRISGNRAISPHNYAQCSRTTLFVFRQIESPSIFWYLNLSSPRMRGVCTVFAGLCYIFAKFPV